MKNSLLSIAAHDRYPIEAMMSIPDEKPNKLVLYVNGSGPNTYNIKRQNVNGSFFNYHDFFANEFTRRGIAYCRYSTRGVADGGTAPYFVDINSEQYRTYHPRNSVGDVECIVRDIRTKYPDIRVYLLGWSEGTIIAPLVALDDRIKIDALLLCGYCNDNLRDTLIWQLNGNAALIQNRRIFDYDRKGYVSKSDFEEDRYHVRQAVFNDKSFEQLDIDSDGNLTAADFAPSEAEHLNGMLSAIDRGDDDWLKNNHGVRLTSIWFKEHFSLKPNKDVLLKLNLPIHIFSGEYDAMTPQFYAKDIEKKFNNLKKTNLTVHYFQNHDHDLNYIKFLIDGEMSEGIRTIFNVAEGLN